MHHNTVKKIIKNYNYHTDSYFNSFNFIDIRENLSVSDFDREQLIKFIGEPAFLFTDGIFHPIDKKDLLNSVNDDLKSIGLKYKLIIESFSPPSVPNRAKRFIVLLENHDGQRFGLDEMGYGITQLIPLLIRKNYFSINQTVAQSSITVIREPEANIHPALQANLAQNLLSTISKGRYNNNNSIIVETHSEHFIRGVQIAIAKGDIKSTDVNILYVNQSKSGNSSLKKIELEEKGKFKSEWPKGFFESGFKEVVELNKLQKS